MIVLNRRLVAANEGTAYEPNGRRVLKILSDMGLAEDAKADNATGRKTDAEELELDRERLNQTGSGHLPRVVVI